MRGMDEETKIDETAEDLARRVAQSSTLSSNAMPFVPSFLRAQLQQQQEEEEEEEEEDDDDDGEIEEMGEGGEPVADLAAPVCGEALQSLYGRSEAYAQLPSPASAATTMAVAAAALRTFGELSAGELRQLEQYLLGGDEEPHSGELGEDEDRLFVNDDEGMDPEEEAWFIQQMIEADSASVKEK